MKPLFLKTYGKQKRKLSAWISPQNHKLAFDSTFSSDCDTSVFEPPKPTKTRKKRTSVASHRVVHPARKKKAIIHLMENSSEDKNITNVENVMIPPFTSSLPARQIKSKRRKKSGVCSDRAVRPAKRKVSCMTMNSSDEENIFKASLSDPLTVHQSKTTRKSQLVSEPSVSVKQNPVVIPATSYSEKDSMSALQSCIESVQMKRSSNVPSVGRFVTRRRRGTTAKHQLPKKSIVNSSDDFSLGSFTCSRNIRPVKRRLPPTFILSSAENSVNVAETSSVTSKAPREISLNESSDHGLGPTSRKPIFCSTPSAESLRKRPRLKPFPVRVQASTPLSMSISCIGSLSPFQKDVDSSDPTASQGSDQPSDRNQHLGLSKKETVLYQHETPSGDLFIESKYTPTSKQIENHSEEPKTMSSEELPLLNLLSTDSQSSSYFMTTAEALEWLIEALKEKCLTERCTVQLERLDSLTVTQLCNETTYSSCLGEEYFVQSSPSIQPVSVVDNESSEDRRRSSEESDNLCISVTDTQNSNFLWPVNSLNSSEQGDFLTDSQSSNISPSVDCKYLSTRGFIKQMASVVYDESIHHINSSTEFNTDAQLPASNCLQTEDMDTIKEKCLVKKCTVQLNKLALSELTIKQLKEFTQQNESHLAYDERSINPAPTKASQENYQTHNIDTPTNLQYVREIHDNDQETTISTAFLKKKCLSNKLTVNVKKATLSEFKALQDLKDKKIKSPTVVSDSASDDQSVIEIDHCNEETFTVNTNMKKKTSIRTNYKVFSDTQKVGDNSCDILPKGKKISQHHKQRKRRSTSVDQPGTTRKACVSGLSVNRWKNKGITSTNMTRKQVAQSSHIKAVDCSIFELISTEHKQQKELGTTMNFSTPVRAIPVNVSSLLADLTPNSNTWSRFKAALAVHRKGIVRLTPRTLAVSGSPRRTNLADISQDLFATPFRTPLPKHLKSQLHRNDSLAECEDLSDAEKVYAECGQRGPLPWEECILPHRMKKCVKIGEGTFGEVFSTTNASGDTVALKIIPVEGSEKVNGEDQKTFGEILHEIIISKELSSLKEKLHNQTYGFIGLNDLHCVQGCYPPDFLNAWDKFDQHKGSENDRPDFFQKDQTFIILEFEFGGIDLENSNGTLASLGVAKSILHQVTAALAVAEQELHFEHRDLHWGNVLVKTTKQKTGSFLLNGVTHSLETKGVLVRIIDYSLSRLEIDDLTVSCDISKDEELFMGQGDYQFEIYRLMRNENGNNWSDYHPHTNILWLHYLSSKLFSMKYRGTGGRGAKEIREELTRFQESILQYSSATEALQNCPMFQ